MILFSCGARARAAALAAALGWTTVVALAGCTMFAPAARTSAASAASAPQPIRAIEIEAFALRLREADQAELLDEWQLSQRAPQPARAALLKLHPVSPVYDPEGALALLDGMDADERRAVLRGWIDIVAAVRQGDTRLREQTERAREQAERVREQAERARDQLVAQAERQRMQLREADRRALDDRQRIEAERQRTELERQRADVLAARLDELQRTMQALRDIDRRQVNRTP